MRIRIRNLNADPDPGTQINADPDTDPDPQPCLYLRRCHVAGHEAAGETEAACSPAVRSGRDLQGSRNIYKDYFWKLCFSPDTIK
jgi:hypothetical protein